jgi:integrase
MQNRRVRFLSREELAKLLEQLPEHHRNLATFAVLTGLRQSNVTNLKWDQVDLQLGVAWIHNYQPQERHACPQSLYIYIYLPNVKIEECDLRSYKATYNKGCNAPEHTLSVLYKKLSSVAFQHYRRSKFPWDTGRTFGSGKSMSYDLKVVGSNPAPATKSINNSCFAEIMLA